MANGPVLVVDFGAQYAQLIARRVREAGVYSELVPHSMPVDEILAKDPKAIILSGGPASVFEPGAPTIDTKVFESGVPVLGICYGFQVMAYELGGKVDKAALGEYGKTSATIDDAAGILADSPAEQTTWMSHGVAVEQAPAGFEVLAHTEGAPWPPWRTNPASSMVCSGTRKSSTPRLARSLSKTSCTVAPRCPTTGMPPRLSRIKSRRSASRSATPR